MTQTTAILSHLISGLSLTPMEALDKYGVFRLSARIRDLREQGHDIRTRMVEVETRNGHKAHVAVYRLERV